MRRKIRVTAIAIVAGALALAAAAVYVQRKRRAEAAAPVQLGAREGLSQDVPASHPGVAAVQAAADQVRAAFQGV